MVDLQGSVEVWLQDASLFINEPVDYANIDFLSDEKENSVKESQTTLGLPDLEWFDEKVDLSVLDNPIGLLDHPNETQPLMEDVSAFLLGLLGSNADPSHLSSADDFKIEDIESFDINDFSKPFDNFVPASTSSEVLDTNLASPQCNSLQINSPVFYSAQSPASPYSDISDAPEDSSSSYVVQSPASSSVASDFADSSFDSSQVQVSVCDNVATPSSCETVLNIKDISRSVRKRKFVNDKETKPKIIKVMYPDMPILPPKIADSRERKKVQNKEAAARYRIKKRMEEKELSDEVANLESTQKELKEKHDNLQAEIKYLKSLMCEMLTKKGIMK